MKLKNSLKYTGQLKVQYAYMQPIEYSNHDYVGSHSPDKEGQKPWQWDHVQQLQLVQVIMKIREMYLSQFAEHDYTK